MKKILITLSIVALPVVSFAFSNSNQDVRNEHNRDTQINEQRSQEPKGKPWIKEPLSQEAQELRIREALERFASYVRDNLPPRLTITEGDEDVQQMNSLFRYRI